MAIIEGAAFHCYTHNFETFSIDEWNNHCDNDQHTEQGRTECTLCGVVIEFTDLPYHKLSADGSKHVSLKCEDCEEKTTGKVKRVIKTK